MQSHILFKKASVKLEREAVAVRLRTMFPCGVNNTENKSFLIKGEVGAEIPAWV